MLKKRVAIVVGSLAASALLSVAAGFLGYAVGKGITPKNIVRAPTRTYENVSDYESFSERVTTLCQQSGLAIPCLFNIEPKLAIENCVFQYDILINREDEKIISVSASCDLIGMDDNQFATLLFLEKAAAVSSDSLTWTRIFSVVNPYTGNSPSNAYALIDHAGNQAPFRFSFSTLSQSNETSIKNAIESCFMELATQK